MLFPFLDFLHKFDPKKKSHDVGFNVYPNFKDLFILNNNYVGIENATIATRYDSKPLIPLLCLAYKKGSFFYKTLVKFWPPRMTIGDVWCKIDSRLNCHGTYNLFVFVIICKLLIFIIIHFNKNVFKSNV